MFTSEFAVGDRALVTRTRHGWFGGRRPIGTVTSIGMHEMTVAGDDGFTYEIQHPRDASLA